MINRGEGNERAAKTRQQLHINMRWLPAGDAHQATDTSAVEIVVDVLDTSVTSKIKNTKNTREKVFTWTLRESFSLGMCVTARACIAFLSDGEISRP